MLSGWCLYCLSMLKFWCGHFHSQDFHCIWRTAAAHVHMFTVQDCIIRCIFTKEFCNNQHEINNIFPFCFSYCDFLPHFLVRETIVLLSLFPFHHIYFEYSRLAEWLETLSTERQRVSFLWQQESGLLKHPWALNPYTSSWEFGV